MTELGVALAYVAERHTAASLTDHWDASADAPLSTAARLLRAACAEATTSVLDAVDERLGAHVLAWACSAAGRQDLRLGSLARAGIARGGEQRGLGRRLAEARVEFGPARDALVALTATRDARWLAAKPGVQARLELALWDAGAAADSMPDLGRWLFGSDVSIDVLLLDPARRTLRHRATAARTLYLAAAGFEERRVTTASRLRLAALVRTLALHPEPVVWIPAVRALGRLAARFDDARTTLEQWEASSNASERRRAVTARVSMPETHAREVERAVGAALDSSEPWTLAALATGGVDLATSHPEAWRRVVERLGQPEIPLEAAWATAQTLVTLARHSRFDRSGRELAEKLGLRVAAPASGVTDVALIAAIERDLALVERESLGQAGKLDIETVSDWLVERHLRGEDVSEACRKIAAGARTYLERAWAETRDGTEVIARGRALFRAESGARALALAHWEAIDAARNDGAALTSAASTLDDAAANVASYLEGTEASYPVARLGLRILSLAVDAHDDWSHGDVPRRGLAAGLLARTLASSPSFDEKKERKSQEKPLADALRRIIDSTRRTAATEPDAVDLVRFALWWRAAGHNPAFLSLLERSDPHARAGRVDLAISAVDPFITALSDPAGGFGVPLQSLARAVDAEQSALVVALGVLAERLAEADAALSAPTQPGVLSALAGILRAMSPLEAALASPEIALAAPEGDMLLGPRHRALLQEALALAPDGAPDVEALSAAAVEGLPGPATTPVKAMFAKLLRKIATPLSKEIGALGGYVVERQLGEGGFSEALLVRDPRTGARLVAKTLRKELAAVSPEHKERLEAALRTEMGAFPSRSPHVVRIVGCDFQQETPYVLMNWVPGVDLETWTEWKLLTVQELQPIIEDVCEGLADLHALGLVHRDIKPGNILLRLDADAHSNTDTFVPRREHRETLKVCGAIVIDIGIAWRLDDSTAGGGSQGSFSPFYSAPEQILPEQPTQDEGTGRISADPTSGVPSIHPYAAPSPALDVYCLAATIYAAVTGVGFFPDRTSEAATMARTWQRPMDDPETAARLDHLPALRDILHDATAINSRDRLTLDELRNRILAL
jgi:serine/threonine-protein kinase